MGYKIIVDSCGDFTQDLNEDKHFEKAALSIHIEEEIVIDDRTFNQKEFLLKVKNSPKCPKSSCPSPEEYMKLYNCPEENVYGVTLSSRLSGSFNSAMLAKDLYIEESGEKNIYIFDSKSASVGETLIAMKIKEHEEAGFDFHTIIEKVEEYIKQMKTFFILESLETLRKNGRLSNLKAFAAEILNIKPFMSATAEGEICQKGQARGMKKGLEKMVNHLLDEIQDCKTLILGIAHCNCMERAEYVKELICSKASFKEIFIVNTGGISSLYAGDGGIIIAV